jgi:hypothetical protein
VTISLHGPCLDSGLRAENKLQNNSTDLSYHFLLGIIYNPFLAYINCTKGFHCDISMNYIICFDQIHPIILSYSALKIVLAIKTEKL